MVNLPSFTHQSEILAYQQCNLGLQADTLFSKDQRPKRPFDGSVITDEFDAGVGDGD